MNTPGGWGPPPPGGPGPGVPPQLPSQVCVRHPNRPTALACTRCDRPACPECLRPAAVGQHCVDCVRAGQRDVRPVRTIAGATTRGNFVPYATYVLIAASVIVFAITAAQSSDVMNNQSPSRLFADWALWPRGIAQGEFFRIIGSGFLHFGPIHLAVNMLALYIIGRDVEHILGRSRYVAVYVTALLGGAAGALALQDSLSVTAGASGAIYGLFGAQAIILIRLRQSPGPIFVLIAINVIISVSIPGISLWGHMGGLAAGAAATAGLLFVPGWLGNTGGPSSSSARLIGWGSIAAVAVLALVVIAVRTLQLRSEFGYS